MLQQKVTKVIAANCINMSAFLKPIKTKPFPSKEPKLFSFPFNGRHSTSRSLQLHNMIHAKCTLNC